MAFKSSALGQRVNRGLADAQRAARSFQPLGNRPAGLLGRQHRLDELTGEVPVQELRPASETPADVLVVEADGSQLPIRGAEPWKDAKVAVV